MKVCKINTFLASYFAIYGVMHAYLLWSLHRSETLSTLGWGLSIGGALLMILSPIIVRRLDRAQLFIAATIAAMPTYGWMAVCFWFLCVGLVLDFTKLIATWSGVTAVADINHFWATATVCLLLTVWAVVEAQWIRLRRISINAPVPKPLRLVQISDVHLGLYTGRRRLRRVLSLIREAEADVLVSTGDLIDSSSAEVLAWADAFGELPCKDRAFGVAGNHEYYVGVDHCREFCERAGIRVLQNERVELASGVWLVGVDDPESVAIAGAPEPDEAELLTASDDMHIVLKHRPEVSSSVMARCALQLSGHTHGGQLFPFGFLCRLYYPSKWGLQQVGERSQLYVSRGTGTWGPPLRFLAPPEVTLFTLEPDRGAGES